MMSEKKEKDREMAEKGSAFLANRAAEAWKSGGVPLSALIANALAMAKSSRPLDLADLARPPKPMGEEDGRRVRDLLSKAMAPGADLQKILQAEMARVWARKTPQETKMAQGKMPEKKAARGKPQQKPSAREPVVVVRKSKKPMEPQG